MPDLMSADIPVFDLITHPVATPGIHILEADAGTGKTYSLTGLILRLLVEEGLPHDRLLAVTFTDAAAAEIAERIRARLRDARERLARDPASDDDPLVSHWRALPDLEDGRPFAEPARARIEAALLVADDLRVSTIHGFCARLLAEHAFDGGIPLVADLGASEDALRKQVVHDYLRALLYDAPEDLVADLTEAGVDETLLTKLARVAPETDAPAQPPRWRDGVEARPGTRAAVIADFTRRFPALFRDAKLAAGIRSFDDLIRDAAHAVTTRDDLRAALRAQTSVALIDEFQDTDADQLRLFSALFGAEHPEDTHRLFYIGDPKQSIYRFRGADLDAYLDAVADARDGGAVIRRLDTNWRSTRAMVEAANALFRPDPELGKPGLFPEERGFAFQGVRPSPRADKIPGLAEPNGVALPALNLVWCGASGDDPYAPLSPTDATGPIADHVALSIAAHLRAGAVLAPVDGEAVPLRARDVAVLVGDRHQAAAVIAALRAAGVPAVSAGSRGVYAGRAAGHLRTLMHALLNPRDTAVLRAVFAGPFYGFSAAEIAGLDEARWQDLLEELDRRRQRWLRDGFAAFFDTLLAEGEFMRRHLALQGGERDFADWRQLSELLVEREQIGHLAPEALLRHLVNAIADADENDEALKERLESDRDAVRVLTMHASKGLEFPVVYVPFAWKVRTPRKGDFVTKTRDGDIRVVPGKEGDRSPEEQEVLADEKAAAYGDMRRLLYVAVTRAKSTCYLYTGAIISSQGGVQEGPLNALVASDCRYGVINRKYAQIDGPNLTEPTPFLDAKKKPKPTIPLSGPDAWRAFAEKYGVGFLTIHEGAEVALPKAAAFGASPEIFHAESFPADRAVDARPIQTSYSGLIHGLVAGAAEVGSRHDETPGEIPDALLAAPAAEKNDDPLAFLPPGASTGTLVHDILEKVDFAAPELALVEAELRAARRPETEAPALLAAIRDWCAAPLSPESGDTFTLADIPAGDRLAELSFDLPATLAEPSRLADALALNPAVPSALVRRLKRLGRDVLDGYLIGFVDLVFRRDGRYYILDWKTNRLGAGRAAYTPAAITASMTSHGYHLQYHLYLLALDAHLRATLGDAYDPERHLGGVFYLYLRGLHPDAPGNGVYADRPKPEVLAALRAALTPDDAPAHV